MKKYLILFLTPLFFSCAGAKYNYTYEIGERIDFGSGKWILNSESLSSNLYETSFTGFKKILGDSLIEIIELRKTKLIPLDIKLDLSKSELKKLQVNSGCDYIINVSGKILSEGIGSMTLPNNVEQSTNRAVVFISIYDLNLGEKISGAEVFGRLEQQEKIWTNQNKPLSFNPSSEMILIQGLKQLIKRYDKKRID